MRLASIAFALLFALAVSDACRAQSPTPQPPEGFTALFNGKDFNGWRGRPHLSPAVEKAWDEARRNSEQASWDAQIAKHWKVEDGVIINDGHGAFLTTAKDYKNFEFYVDYLITPLADSGIYLKANPQVQLWNPELERDNKHGNQKGSGGLWNNQKNERWPLVKADNPAGQWNTLFVRMIGDKVTVHLNGKLVVNNTTLENVFDRASPLPEAGPIQLQTHGGEIRFRNIYIRELPDDGVATAAAASDEAGFVSIFNGKDFTGWKGAVENHEVVDGAIQCKAGKGGTLFTEQQYSDFVVRFEFKLPPGGNNGLAIRYPGNGDTAYEGMCELQVLDNSADKYKKLDPRQFHGSVYGVIAAKREGQKPIGEWNEQEVIVKGSTIKVTLNGVVILDGDVSKVTEFMGNKRHPGLNRTTGHFGFAGHRDAVAFRNIRIKPLN